MVDIAASPKTAASSQTRNANMALSRALFAIGESTRVPVRATEERLPAIAGSLFPDGSDAKHRAVLGLCNGVPARLCTPTTNRGRNLDSYLVPASRRRAEPNEGPGMAVPTDGHVDNSMSERLIEERTISPGAWPGLISSWHGASSRQTRGSASRTWDFRRPLSPLSGRVC
jgi:hypothetical protein